MCTHSSTNGCGNGYGQNAAVYQASATQNQAMNALVFLYKQVLDAPLAKRIEAIRAGKRRHIPVVLAPDEVKQVLARLEGVPQLAVKLVVRQRLED